MTQTEMHTVWMFLAQTWGAKFLDQYGKAPNEVWTAAMTAMSPEAARHAIKALIGGGSAFPPTLPEFVAAAAEYRPPQAERPAIARPPGYEPTLSELRLSASPEIAAFRTYAEYEAWREAKSKRGVRPPHPVRDSHDWLYLNRLAVEAIRQRRSA